MTDELLEQALQEIADHPKWTAAQKLAKQAKVKRDYRSVVGKVDVTIARKNQTSIWGTFFRSVARTGGRKLVKEIFK